MYARAVDDAAVRLRELRHEQREALGVAALALGLALVATQVYQPIVLPLFLGGLVVGAAGVRALWRHWDLVDRLAGERDAHVISEVRAYAAREATMERRRSFAVYIRSILERPVPALEERVARVAEELEALTLELEDDALALDPACAVGCMRLVSDPASPLLDPALTAEELRARLCRIRSGFTAHELEVADDRHPVAIGHA